MKRLGLPLVAALTIALVDGEVSTGTALDEDLDGELEAPDGVEILDVVGINDGRSGAMAWGTELSASQFDDYTGTLGGASRIPDASDNWVPNAFNGVGLDHERAADAPRGEFEAWNTPGTANEVFTGEDNEPEPEPTEPEPSDPAPTDPAPAEPGEICIAPAGPADDRYRTMLGYWERPDATAEALAGGELHTGDIGFLDDQGRLHVRDRKSLVILRGGANVYPAEVERVLLDHPSVQSGAVLGVPDDRLGERVAAVVEAATGTAVDVDDVRAHLLANLARYKVPEQITVVDALPRNAMGKIVRTELPTLLE